LQEAIANEEYERASQISRQIEELKRGRKKEEN
ncbi:MAG: UvrB/UvrC motif-containing protein, partial [Bacteroidales bacterium]|nr:UvrB/UvrC motif-containing protein [Bacteroidales bacterium]